ncbi:MAG: L-threonylcarbamoyladenylate synthase [Gemmatimonadaceae bacterium]
MRTDTLSIPFWSPEEVEAAIRPAIAHITERRVLAYPTETVYGFGGGTDSESVDALVALKKRPPAKPFLLLIAGPDMIDRLDLRLPSYAANLVARHWPGPLTLVLAGGGKSVSPKLRGPEGGVAVRWTSHPGIARLIRAYGEAITSTSANLPGVPPAKSATEILEQWGDAIARGRLKVLDAGTLTESAPSTVLDCTGQRARVIRPGAIPASTLRDSVPNLIGDA